MVCKNVVKMLKNVLMRLCRDLNMILINAESSVAKAISFFAQIFCWLVQ
jgi:hypothetical protein